MHQFANPVFIIVVIAIIVIITLAVYCIYFIYTAYGQEFTYQQSKAMDCRPFCLPDKYYNIEQSEDDDNDNEFIFSYSIKDIFNQNLEMRGEHGRLSENQKDITDDIKYSTIILISMQEQIRDIKNKIDSQTTQTTNTDILQSAVIGIMSLVLGIVVKKKR